MVPTGQCGGADCAGLIPFEPPLPGEQRDPSQKVLGGHAQPPCPLGTMLLKQVAGGVDGWTGGGWLGVVTGGVAGWSEGLAPPLPSFRPC